MSFSLRSIALGLVLATFSLLSGCGGGSAKPAPGMGCALNSDCAAGLICTFGLCHGACVPNAANGDCPAPQLCVKSSGTADGGGSLNVCQLPVELKCVYNSDCMSPLICARDEQCRNQCQTDVDCVSGQVCTDSKVCALTSQLVQGTNDVKVVTAGLDGGAAGAGATGTGGGAGGSVGTGGSVSTGTGGAAGATGLAGSSGKGGATGTGGAAGASGTCSPACAVGKQCVAGTCQSCGVSGATCCGTGTTATCNSNLSCVGGTCTCGDASQACCDGTTCNTGFQCVNGTCSCGGAGQYCCAGATKCTGTLICGGRRCGCATSCDENAVLKNDGSIFISGTPVTNTNGTLFLATSVSYNGTFACALKADGTVWCWGSNSYGALGIGDTTITSSKVPLQVSTAMASGSPLTGITAISVADVGYDACALGANGTVWCWGYGAYAQLGIGDESNSSFAVPVVVDAGAVPVTGFKSISASYYNTCGMKTDNSVWCWGDNYYGEIGKGTDGQTTTAQRYIPYPTQVTNLATSGTSVIASYYYYTVCASTADGSAYCWGYNAYGDLANGLATGYSNIPSQVLTAAATPLTGVVKVLNWSGKPCALRTDGSIWCWPDAGTNYYAVQLKDSQSNRVTGLSVVGRDCYLDTDDQVWYNGSTSTSYQVTCP
jgi:hypothetical protein